jgi:hypothetical protein
MAGTIEAISQAIAIGLKMLDKHIEDPKRRLKARLEYKQKLLAIADKICKEVNPDEANKLLGDFIRIINEL